MMLFDKKPRRIGRAFVEFSRMWIAAYLSGLFYFFALFLTIRSASDYMPPIPIVISIVITACVGIRAHFDVGKASNRTKKDIIINVIFGLGWIASHYFLNSYILSRVFQGSSE